MKRQISDDDLLSSVQASELLGGHVGPMGIRKRIREGALPAHHMPAVPGRVFVKRSELLALYHEQIYGWKDVADALRSKRERS